MTPFLLYNQQPTQIVAPTSAEAVADVLRDASAQGLAVIPWGGGTRQGMGGPPLRYDLALDMRGLAAVLAYTPDDLVLRVGAGATLGHIQDLLAAHNQWLPWNPPLPDQATIGGLLASGATGSLRMGYGTPRDWTLAMQVALGDGRLVKSGAPVVKNVAGYDTHKLHIGALGTLGVITEVTFKVAPRPAHCQTLLAAFSSPLTILEAMQQIGQPPFQPISLVLLNHSASKANPILHSFLDDTSPHLIMAVRFAGTAGAVGRQIRTAVAVCVEQGAHTIELSETDDGSIWHAIADDLRPTDQLLIRVGAPLSHVREMLRLVESIPYQRGWPTDRYLIAGAGLAYLRWPVVALPDLLQALTELRAGLAGIGGYAVVEDLPVALANTDSPLDLWGPPPETLALMRSLRKVWDPAEILNPGRYLV
ncbi:FAD linked oxidase domain protein [Oscillochloris trichoides DG-6]|uniref:FAD linked oxidase domain protein n=1 Tax=Oscillochloris trichoides DG-6 TaxID=765420 RepID=E1IBU5_9CHLR|nr:FAD-binding oxidoreductase [Oscillochloris trichoides]EFO81325.1 FAD linked oxidase domain protein [Oscillochloris trichoides DG-6]